METDFDLNRLINYVREGQKRIDGAKRKIVEHSNDFELWKEFSDKKYFRFILDKNTKIMKVLEKEGFIFERRYKTIDFKFVLGSAEQLIEDGVLYEFTLEELKEEIVKLNFGSMCVDW